MHQECMRIKDDKDLVVDKDLVEVSDQVRFLPVLVHLPDRTRVSSQLQ